MITHCGENVWKRDNRGFHHPLYNGREPDGKWRAWVHEEQPTLAHWYSPAGRGHLGMKLTQPRRKLEIKQWLTATFGPFSRKPDRPWWIGSAVNCTTILPEYESLSDGRYRQTNAQNIIYFRSYFFRREEDWFMFCMKWL